MKSVTATWLRKKSACPEQVAIFVAEWGKEAPITREDLERAATLKLDLEWLAQRLLPVPAWAEYERVRAAALVDALLLGVEA